MRRTAMTPRRRRLARVLTAACWWALVAWFARQTLHTRDAQPEHLIATVVLAYLAAWCPVLAMARWSPAGKLARIGACTTSLVAAFTLMESPAALGVVDYREVFHTPTPPWKRSGNLPDPDLLFVRKPDQRLRLRFQGSDRHDLRGMPPGPAYDCDTTLDAQGFRNPARLESAEVALIGDSFVEGLQVADAELVSARLSALIDAPVANLGRTGYGPRQELAVLNRYGPQLGPRTCVWFFYEGNDLQDLDSYPTDRDRVRALRPESFRKAWYARSFARNAAGWLVRRDDRDAAIPAQSRTGRRHDASSSSATDLYFSCGVHEGNASAVAGRAKPEKLERLKEVFADAAASCRRQGMDLVVAFVPAKFRVYRDLCEFDADSPCPGWQVDDLPAKVQEAVRAASPEISFLDLTPALRTRAEAGELVYLADDTHWSAQGHQAAAEAVAEVLGDRRRLVRDQLTSARSPGPDWPTGSTGRTRSGP
ncbi:alginate O-acetyltransferase AlgX-related protein [Paludisphaera rhizosphaerae]|uniref:alginate O-acetyltransferase AlgX-related protein n=1 Tax=Paludisphaera rhizosphaerae TaxID=2711216 RepID=UPI0013EB8ECC|nr:hypothetical protein [Paludisphaera rhizosphaerae]